MSEPCEVCGREKIVRGQGEQEDRCWRGFLGQDDMKCYRLGFQRSQEALAAARRECEGPRKGDVEPHLRTEGEIRELQPRVDFMAQRMCQTQGMVLWALKEAGLTVVLLDPHAREIAPDGAALAAPAAGEEGKR